MLDISLNMRYNQYCSQRTQLNIAELCNGSTTDSDSVCWGSNPYSAAILALNFYSRLNFRRGVAQFGGALRSGRRGRRFKSCHLDQKRPLASSGAQ